MNSIGINSIGYKGLRPLFYWYWQNVKVLLKFFYCSQNVPYLYQTKVLFRCGTNINFKTLNNYGNDRQAFKSTL